MPRPKLIPPDLYPDILKRAGEGQTSQMIADWLGKKIGREVNRRLVSSVLEKIAEERRPIAQAVVKDRLSKTLNKDMDAVDRLLAAAEVHQVNAEKLGKLQREAEFIAHADVKDVFDEKGVLLALDKMPEATRRAISSIKVEQLTVEGQADDGPVSVTAGRVVEIKFWEKPKAIELAAKIHSGHMAMAAMDMQKKILELRFRLSGAGGGSGDAPSGVVELPMERD